MTAAGPPARPGLVVVVTGPDGSGKTEVAQALVAQALAPPVLHLHHRPGVLPSKTRHDGPVTEPHANVAYPPWLSAWKLAYLWLDFVLGWWLRIRPVVRRGGSVVLERGWWDLAVDPQRYRLAPLHAMIRVLGKTVPRPDVTLILTAAPEVLLARKQELPAEELVRQTQAWDELTRTYLRAVVLDASQPIAAVVADATAALPTRRSAGHGV